MLAYTIQPGPPTCPAPRVAAWAFLKAPGKGLTSYQETGDSGKLVLRHFCPNCGSGVMAEAEMLPGLKIILVGGFDDPTVYQPTMEIYCSSAQPWVRAGGQRQQFPKMPG